MKSITSQWFVCKVRYEKTGTQKKVTESYIIDAVSFAEAEERIAKEVAAYISGEFNVKAVNLAPYSEIFFDDGNANADKYYKAKLSFITIDEKLGSEKRKNVNYLVQASDFNAAVRNIGEVMGGTMADYDVVSVAETPILDIFQYAINKTEDAE